MSQVKFVNTQNLITARENIGLDTLSASKKVTTTDKDVVKEWEIGKSLPTWAQVGNLAKLYNVPQILLLSKHPIEKFKHIPDYRVGKKSKNASNVNKLVNIVITRQKWLEQKLRNDGWVKNKLQGSGINKTPEQLAQFITTQLNINLSEIKQISGENARAKTLNYLTKKAEAKGVFVGKTLAQHRLEVEDLRGLFVSNDFAPFIVLNRRDAIAAQIFSFIHELAHLFRKTDALSNSLSFRSSEKNVDPEEVFCNQVAANLLLPADEFTKSEYFKEDIRSLSDLFKVSEIFIFYRLKDLGKIPRYMEKELEMVIRREMDENIQLKKLKSKDKEGGSHVNNMKNSNGDLFNRLVFNSYLDKRIGYTEATNLLRFSPEPI